MIETWESNFRAKSRRRSTGWSVRSVARWVGAALALLAFVTGVLTLVNHL
jgi:hypothetical protein